MNRRTLSYDYSLMRDQIKEFHQAAYEQDSQMKNILKKNNQLKNEKIEKYNIKVYQHETNHLRSELSEFDDQFQMFNRSDSDLLDYVNNQREIVRKYKNQMKNEYEQRLIYGQYSREIRSEITPIKMKYDEELEDNETKIIELFDDLKYAEMKILTDETKFANQQKDESIIEEYPEELNDLLMEIDDAYSDAYDELIKTNEEFKQHFDDWNENEKELFYYLKNIYDNPTIRKLVRIEEKRTENLLEKDFIRTSYFKLLRNMFPQKNLKELKAFDYMVDADKRFINESKSLLEEWKDKKQLAVAQYLEKERVLKLLLEERKRRKEKRYVNDEDKNLLENYEFVWQEARLRMIETKEKNLHIDKLSEMELKSLLNDVENEKRKDIKVKIKSFRNNEKLLQKEYEEHLVNIEEKQQKQLKLKIKQTQPQVSKRRDLIIQRDKLKFEEKKKLFQLNEKKLAELEKIRESVRPSIPISHDRVKQSTISVKQKHKSIKSTYVSLHQPIVKVNGYNDGKICSDFRFRLFEQLQDKNMLNTNYAHNLLMNMTKMTEKTRRKR
ncbi:hypothetical protein SNEBB_001125 [Seison nebaliae]|nr:hypothetical protein SNEBB_001125 [Seison nebaliae]